ncbi:helix-turn-helix transcriptional regulator [Streptomyces sp. NPDC047108]|uniref:helix-turn-helix domain-containing protein n=1 Tax=Streptomyces sp. NPDC047108 TaxID=3155025 RepID=UPI0033D56452
MARDRAALGNRVSTVLARRLGGELLRLRTAAGLTQPQAADALSATAAKIAKMERGWVPFRDPDVRALCALYGLSDQKAVDALLEVAKLDRERRKASGWWKRYPDVAIAEYLAMEDAAVRIRTWQVALVPGLLHTPEYTAALARDQAMIDDPDEIQQCVEVKQNRQRRLHGETPLNVWAVVWESVLRQRVGGVDVMRRQLEHLLRVSHYPNVSFQVVPFSAGGFPGMIGPFNIVTFAEPTALDVVYADNPSGMICLESESGALAHDKIFDRTVRLALSERDSRDLVERIHKEI